MQAGQVQSQEQRLTIYQLQGLHLLQMSIPELLQYIREQAQENPFIEPADETFLTAGTVSHAPERLQWPEQSDYQNREYYGEGEEFDVFSTIGDTGGLEDTLQRHLMDQIGRLPLSGRQQALLAYLVDSLDESGYLLLSSAELASEIELDIKEVEDAVRLLRTLDPAGVGATSLAECLSLQLRRQNAPALVVAIAEAYLEDLAHYRYHNIAKNLRVSKDEVLLAREWIRHLEPRPGNCFTKNVATQYVVPDIIINKSGNSYQLRSYANSKWFTINKYYRRLLGSTDDTELKAYLSENLAKAELLQQGIEQRESTLEKCCQVILERQRAYFDGGKACLIPLSMSEAAKELGVSVSTVSRTVKNKHLQYLGGVIPLEHFFARGLVVGDQPAVSDAAVKNAICELIRTENKAHPLSDQKICDALLSSGCTISRRTIAKYRDALGIPNANGRRV